MVAYRTTDGSIDGGMSSATAGTDYTAVSGVLVFDDGIIEKTSLFQLCGTMKLSTL